MKEEEFVKKLQEMMIEEEKQRIPIAQGLPWTTDEPEVSHNWIITDQKHFYFTRYLDIEFNVIAYVLTWLIC